MKKVVIITMMATICSFANAQKNNAFAMIRLKSKDAQYNGKLIYRLTYSEFTQSATKNVYSKVYSYVLAVDSLSLNKLRDAIQSKLKTYGSNINKTQVIAAIEQLATDNALKQLMNNANVFRVNDLGSLSNFDGSSSVNGASPGSMPASLYNQLFNLAGQINDPNGFAMDEGVGTSENGGSHDQEKDAKNNPATDSPTYFNTQDDRSTDLQVVKNADGSTTTVHKGLDGYYYYADTYQEKGIYHTKWTTNHPPKFFKTPTPDNGTVSNPAQYLQFIVGSKLFSAMAKQLFTSLEIKFGGAIDAPDKGTTIEQELAFEATMMAHFFQAWKTDIAARKTGNDGTPLDPTTLGGAVEISFNSNLGTIDPAQIATIASLKVNGNAIIIK